MKTLILCLGNERVSDDGIGAEIGRVLQLLSLPRGFQVKLVSRLRLDLLDDLVGVNHLVIVDALNGNAEPGTCTVVDVTEHSPAVVSSGCCHSGEVCDLIQLAREVACDGSEFLVTIAGVERGNEDVYGAGFSGPVLDARRRLVDLVLMVTGAGLKPRLLAADIFQNDQCTQRIASRCYEWNATFEQAASLQ